MGCQTTRTSALQWRRTSSPNLWFVAPVAYDREMFPPKGSYDFNALLPRRNGTREKPNTSSRSCPQAETFNHAISKLMLLSSAIYHLIFEHSLSKDTRLFKGKSR